MCIRDSLLSMLAGRSGCAYCARSISKTWMAYLGTTWRKFAAAFVACVTTGTMCFGAVMEFVSFVVAPLNVVMVIAGRMCDAP